MFVNFISCCLAEFSFLSYFHHYFFWFSTFTVVSSASREFYFSFSIVCVFVSSCLTTLVNASRMVLNRRRGSGHPCLVLGLSAASGFDPVRCWCSHSPVHTHTLSLSQQSHIKEYSSIPIYSRDVS